MGFAASRLVPILVALLARMNARLPALRFFAGGRVAGHESKTVREPRFKHIPMRPTLMALSKGSLLLVAAGAMSASGAPPPNKVKESSAQVWLCFDDAFSRLADGIVVGLP